MVELQSFKDGDYKKALEESFLKVDEVIMTPACNKVLDKYTEGEEAQRFGSSDKIAKSVGCTAVVGLLTPTEIYISNAGDSRGVLSKSKVAVELSEDHKPENYGEKARIEAAGGFVEDNRVKGVLNLSRSLGDCEYKLDSSLPVDKQMIIAWPEIRVAKRAPENEFLILACDGIWDCMTS